MIMNLTKQERLAELRPLSPEAVASLLAAWEVRMVYESNSIEGNSLTLRETEIVLSKGVTVSGKPLKDHLEAVNLAKAWDELKKLALPGSDFTEKNLLDIRGMILAGIESGQAGSYRTSAVRIAGSDHVPPNPVKGPDLMDQLFAETRDEKDPLTRAARLHHGIARIHPFTDGNGRAARLAMNFVLIAEGLCPVSISPDLRQGYYQALEAADQGRFSEWLGFLEQQLDRELDFYLEALEPLQN